jgi:hypothetical protein
MRLFTTPILLAAIAFSALPGAMPGALAQGSPASQSASASRPQEDSRFLKLEFVVREVDENGKVLSTRSYSSSAHAGDESRHSIRTGSRVPVATGSSVIPGGTPGAIQTQFQYMEAGVNIDFQRPEMVQNQLSMIVTCEISSFMSAADAQPGTTAVPNQPIIRQNKWDANVLIPLNKPTILFSSDDVATRHKMQLELTASLMK